MAIDFSLSPELEELRARVRTFVDDVIKPTEERIEAEHLQESDRKAYYGALIGMRKQAKEAGLWLPHMPAEWGGMGLGHVELAMVQAEAAKTYYGPWVFNCQAPDEGNMHTLLHWGTDEQKEKYLRPLCDGHGVVVLRDDRARGGRVRSDPDPDQGLPGRRGVGAQRAQVVHLQRPPGQLRHPHRPHRGRPGPPAGGQHRVPRRPPRRRLERGPPDRDDARVDRALRDRHRRPAGPRVADARRTRAGSPARPVPARSGPPGPLHALDRPGRDGARHDGRPLAAPVLPRLAARREAGDPVDDRRLDDGAVPGEADGAPRRLQDRPAARTSSPRCRWRSTSSPTCSTG